MRRLLFALLGLVSLTLAADARERIQNFVSDATVNTDGSLDVTETISINAEGDEINHGIYRDFPTTYTDHRGVRVVVDFEVLSVELDGEAENYVLESLSNGVRVKIGRKDAYVSHALHSYEIKYHTARQLGFFDSYDELYWNVTGNGWAFPVDQATAIVRLPEGANIIQSAAYTGYEGYSGDDFKVINSKGNVYRAVLTRSLAPKEGFTVAVGWQKGIVREPTDVQKSIWFWKDNVGFVGLAMTLLGVAWYCAFAWLKVGRDPPKGTIVPLFAPPPALGPAASRFVWKQKFDEKAFASSLVGLAVKSRLKIRDDDGDFEITKLDNQGPALTVSESALFASIPAGKTALQNTNYAAIGRMKDALQNQLTEDYVGKAFRRNMGWFGIGLLLSVVGLVVSGFLLPGGNAILALIACAVALIVLNLVFYFFISAPTVPGRRLMDQVEGFRMYLKTAEEDRLNVLNPPTKTPELFERYLPYALALDCENEWSAKFTKILSAAALAGASAPIWYSGNSWNTGSMGGFTRSLGSGLASSAASAAQAPGSSSSSGGGFSSGGGSSGGGGGGGGGGGW